MVTVIIPTRNRAASLSSLLDSLCNQNFLPDRFEVLVIDNGSIDETRIIAHQYQRKMRNIRYFFVPAPGLHIGRHFGLKEAKGDVLAYVDDDVQVETSWLQTVDLIFRDPNVALAGGNNYPDFKVPPADWVLQLWNRPFMGGNAIPHLSVVSLPDGRYEIPPHMVWGCNFSIRKNILCAARGFHPDSMPDELLRFRGDGETHVSKYIAEKGLLAIFDSRASVWHAVPANRMTLAYFRKRAYNQGISDSFEKLRNPKRGDKIMRSAPIRFLSAMKTKLADKFLEPNSKALNGALDAAITEGYWDGFYFHQKSYHADPEVRAWVHKEDYF